MDDEDILYEDDRLSRLSRPSRVSRLNTSGSTKEMSLVFVCFNCKTHIPQIKLIQDGNVVKSHMKCYYCNHETIIQVNELLTNTRQLQVIKPSCQLNPDHFNQPSTRFCITEQKWICQLCVKFHEHIDHVVCQTKIDFNDKCKVHKASNRFICKDCHNAICEKCKESDSHKHHSVISIETNIKEYDDKLDYENKYNVMKERKNKNTNIKNTLIKLINVKIKELIKLRTDLEEVYSIHEENSIKLLEYILLAKDNFENLNSIALPEIVPNVIENYIMSSDELVIDTIKDLEQSCHTAIKYFHSNHFLKLPKQSISYIKQKAHSDLIMCMIQLHDGRIATCSCDNTIKLWIIGSQLNDSPQELTNHKCKVLSMSQLKKSNHLVSGGEDGKILIWNLMNCKIVKELIGHTDAVYSLLEVTASTSTSTSQLMSTSADETICFWDIEAGGAPLKQIEEDTTTILQLTDETIATTDNNNNDCSIKIWESSTNFVVLKKLVSHKREIHSVIQLNNWRLASGSKDEVLIWDLASYTPIKKIISENKNFTTAYYMTQISNGTLVIGCMNRIITIDLSSMTIDNTHEGHTDLVTGLIELKDKRIVSCSWDDSILIRNIS